MDTQVDKAEVERLVKWLQEDIDEVVMTIQPIEFLGEIKEFLAEVYDIIKNGKPYYGASDPDLEYLCTQADKLRIGLETDCDPTKAIDRLSENVDRLAKELHIEY